MMNIMSIFERIERKPPVSPFTIYGSAWKYNIIVNQSFAFI